MGNKSDSLSRRKLIAYSGIGLTALAGCTSDNSPSDTQNTNNPQNNDPSNQQQGNGNSQTDTQSNTNTDTDTDTGTGTDTEGSNGENCKEKPAISGIAGETIQFDGVEVTVSEPIVSDTYNDGETPPDGKVAVLVNLIATVTGDTQQTLRGSGMLHKFRYYGSSVETPSFLRDFTINGEEYTNLQSLNSRIEKFPGDGITGAKLFFLPEDFEPGAMVLTIVPNASPPQNVALGDPSGVEYPCVSTNLPLEPVSFGDVVEYEGLKYSVVDYILTCQQPHPSRSHSPCARFVEGGACR